MDRIIQRNNRVGRVVTGVIGNDIHVVANRLIEISLEERGFEVFNLGVNTHLDEFLDAALETDADIVLISSLNGEAEGWCRDLSMLREDHALSEDVVFVIGGNLAVGEVDPDAMVEKFRDFGFDLVFHQVDLNEGLDEMERFIRRRDGFVSA